MTHLAVPVIGFPGAHRPAIQRISVFSDSHAWKHPREGSMEHSLVDRRNEADVHVVPSMDP
jgi:hypothetical protein